MTDFTPRHVAIQQVITRETLLSGEFLRKLADARGGLKGRSDEELRQSLSRALAARPADGTDEIWLFGYGSLIWNPAFHFAERQLGRVHGWHRRFCLWTELGRGSPDCPGLVLGLRSGGACTGMAYRLDPEHAEAELSLVWRREMLHDSYFARWVKVHRADGRVVPALTFVINAKSPRYAGRLDDDQVAATLARATGYLGRCADYFFSTIHALEELGVHDRQLFKLYDRVIRLCAEQTRAAREEASQAETARDAGAE